MNIWKAAVIGGAVFVAVKLYKEGKIPIGLGIPAPAGTLPTPDASDTATPGGGGIVTNDPTVLPGQNAPEQSAGGGGGVLTAPTAPGYAPGTAGSARKPIVRDHRTKGPSSKPKPGGPVIACVRAPCPVKPQSGGVSVHGHSVAIQRMGGRTPMVW